jgi:hypothetical protein
VHEPCSSNWIERRSTMVASGITTIDELKESLYKAMQLEHATVPVYLTALYSITPGTNKDAVEILRVVAVEEMLHLTLAANLLNAVGGFPNLTRPGFVPDFPAYLPDGEDDFKVHLVRFCPEAIATFLKIERPSLAPKGKPKLVKRLHAGEFPVLGAHPSSPEIRYYSIGDFYQVIEDGFITLEAKAKEEGRTIFIGDRARQVPAEYFYSGGGKLFPVTDLESARSAILKIIEQGEGETKVVYDHQGELGHYFRLDQISQGRYYQPGDKPGKPTGPTLTVDWGASYPIREDVKLKDFPPDSELYQAATTFNCDYAEFLRTINKAYNGDPSQLMKAVPKMFQFRNLMNQLIRNPLPQGDHAAPTFEIHAA